MIRLYLTVVLGAVVAGLVGAGVVAEARALGGWAALQVLIPASLVVAGVYVLYRGDRAG